MVGSLQVAERQGNPGLGQQRGPKQHGLKVISLQALEINQASVSQVGVQKYHSGTGGRTKQHST